VLSSTLRDSPGSTSTSTVSTDVLDVSASSNARAVAIKCVAAYTPVSTPVQFVSQMK
jgi:hypothetical protein